MEEYTQQAGPHAQCTDKYSCLPVREYVCKVSPRKYDGTSHDST